MEFNRNDLANKHLCCYIVTSFRVPIRDQRIAEDYKRAPAGALTIFGVPSYKLQLKRGVP